MTNLQEIESRSLDPEDWEEFRRLFREVMDDMVDYLKDSRKYPAWQSPSAEACAFLKSPPPGTGAPLSQVYRGVKKGARSQRVDVLRLDRQRLLISKGE